MIHDTTELRQGPPSPPNPPTPTKPQPPKQPTQPKQPKRRLRRIRHKTVKPTRRTDQPTLRFALPAWLKLQLLCHAGDTEIGCFAITTPEDPLHVIDVVTVAQVCSPVSVEFDDAAVADFFDDQVDKGRNPEQFARIWLHTHPGHCPNPSITDEQTFQRVFGSCDWAIMFILARGGDTYCRLRVNSPRRDNRMFISVSTTIPCEVDWSPVAAKDLHLPLQQWMEEYKQNVRHEIISGLWWGDDDLLMQQAEISLDGDEVDLDELDELEAEARQAMEADLDEALGGHLRREVDDAH